ncbi:MAG: AraC family transcriptional regulator [Prevotellaceae bacterium]|jgi:AraC-like DNA-binding protein|nr:AraC family transcriptional regulator [Prevotellaceae bacterium]
MKVESICIRQVDCSLCPKKSEGVFVYRHHRAGQHFAAEKQAQNCMLFLLNGDLLMNSNEYPGTTLKAKQFVLQAIGSKVELLALTDVEYLLYWFTELPVICEEQYKEIINRSEVPLTYTPLTFNSKLSHLFSGLVEYLNEQPVSCGKYIQLKSQELIYILTTYYPMQQMSMFFHPISAYTESFHYFIMQNYDKVKNVEEFAHLGGYTTTTFRRLFKNMYGIPVYEWILDKKREGILEDLQFTKQRISAISARYGFDSLSHFAHFCKDSFGDTPRSLRKRTARGEKIQVIKRSLDLEEQSKPSGKMMLSEEIIEKAATTKVKKAAKGNFPKRKRKDSE